MATQAQSIQLSPDSAARFEDLLRSATAIAGYRDIKTFRERFGPELQRFIDFDYVLINILDDDQKAVRWRTFHAPGLNDQLQIPDFSLDETPTAWVLANQKPSVIGDWQEENRYPRLRDYLAKYNIRSSCVLPLTTVNRKIGVFAIGFSRPYAYSADEVQFLSMVAQQLALAIDSALNLDASREAQAKLEGKNEQLKLVLDLTNRVVSNLELRELLREVSASVRKVLRCDATGVALPEPEGDVFRVYALDFPDSKGFLTEETILPMNSPIGAAYRSGKIELRNQSQIQQHCPEACAASAKSEGLKSGCFVPLISKGRVLGVMALSRFAPEPFTPSETEFLGQITQQIAIAIENALAYREIAQLKEKLAQEKLYLEEEIRNEFNFEEIVGESPTLAKALREIEIVAPSDSTVLILGETGTGKELVARALHNRSRRKDRTFVKLNCAAIPTGLLESELFGHEKGAFTGAIAQKTGRLELADRGTLFLDEVGDIPLELQPKLLRALQEREFERLGSSYTRRVDMRLIAATNRDLQKMISDREFRSDLYYRLNVFPIHIPALRERPEDIALLVRHFTEKFARRMDKRIETIPSGTMQKLMAWHWPGNVRELENFIERAVILTRGSVLNVPISELENGAVGATNGSISNGAIRESQEYDQLVRALKDSGGRVGGPSGAAARLGLKRTTLISRMKKLGINAKDSVQEFTPAQRPRSAAPLA
jgi:formate hydrogenlyase transcriptional activator